MRNALMTTGQRAGLIGAVVGAVWIAILVAFIAANQTPAPGAADAESLRSAVQEAIQIGDDAALQSELPVGEVGQGYAAELLDRLPEDPTMLQARLDQEHDTEVITVVGAAPLRPCVHWAVVLIEDRYYLDPVPLTTACRP